MIDYGLLAAQIESLAEGEDNTIGVLANASALIKEVSGWFWVGFYIVNGDKLTLGPFQGSPACMSIGYGKGVCGTAWERGETLIVDDVEEFPGHIACSALSRSEIVVPLKSVGKVVGVLDIDSTATGTFTTADARGLEKVCDALSRLFL